MAAVADQYQALSDIEHVLRRPGMYIGSCESVEEEMFVADVNATKPHIVKKSIKHNAGLIRIYEEILLNAFDHTVRDPSCKEIRVTVDQHNNTIQVMNNGAGIPVVIKEDLGIYIPEMLFGMLRSGSNFDENEKRVTGGMNGVGACLCVIFSQEFTLETVDAERRKYYSQTWRNNMSIKDAPTIRSSGNKKSYTRVTFIPDLARFGMELESLSNDTVMLMKKRLIDIGYATSTRVNCYFNDQKISIKKPEDYIKLYDHPESESILVDSPHERWSIGVVLSNSGFQYAAFVNGIHTTLGGTHVEAIANQIAKVIIAKLATKKITVKPSDVKNKMFLFIRCTIENPTFNSQTKECMTTPKTKFGSEYAMSDAFKKKLASCAILKRMSAVSDTKQQKDLERTSGAKTNRINDVEGLEDAAWAGMKNSIQAKLILTEGLSARTFAMSALNVIGRERFGIFPLKGKLLNVRNVPITRVSANEEICNIVKIIGLKYELTYESDADMQTLRYGGVVCLCDSDSDGSHISGLIINYFHNFWPHLIGRGFVNYCITPLVKVFTTKEQLEFYTLHSYEQWVTTAKGNFKTKYYKGLGTSTAKEAREALSDIDTKLIAFQRDDRCDESVSLAFDKKRADDRKQWLMEAYDPTSSIDRSQRTCDVSNFINLELSHFSTYDCARSIPNVLDGLKPSQRKIIFVALKHIASSEMKVAQFAAKVAELTDYHHGEQSLCGAIIGMSQDYVGANNINLLEPRGAFGTRLQAGQDAASPRYIFTQMSSVTPKLFDSRDSPLLTQIESDGIKIEPKYYAPVLPMILVNGTSGIGTGFSSSVLQYNPIDIANYLKALLSEQEPKQLMPWYRGFTGEIVRTQARKYTTFAVWEFKDDRRALHITDLPIGVWTDSYKKFCEKKLGQANSPLRDVEYGNTDTVVDFRFIFKATEYKRYRSMDRNALIKEFGLSSKLSETNMYLFNADGKLQYFTDVNEIIAYYYDRRLDFYAKRKEAMIMQLQYEMLILANKARFIEAVKCGKINQRTMTDASLMAELKRTFEADPRVTNESAAFDYLIGMSYRSFTNENAERMKNAVKTKSEEIQQLEATTREQMWIIDIDAIAQLIQG